MKRVAFFMYGVSNLKGGGGAERFFADFYDQYSQSFQAGFKLYFIIDADSVKNLNDVNKLSRKKNLLKLVLFSNRFKIFLETIQLYFYIIFYKIQILHIPLYNLSYLPILQKVNRMFFFFRPKLVINIVNCYAAQALSDNHNEYHESISSTYLPLFREVKVDGYFCWNESFKNYLLNHAILNHQPAVVRSITSRFSDTVNYKPSPAKNKWIVFASRLDAQKHPEWVLLALVSLKKSHPQVLQDWKVKICGDGPLRTSLIQFAKEHEILTYVDFIIEGEMHKILNHSKIYISCQDYDNFPSLTMAEAMASGNAIVARNVGQTNLFLKDSENGLLIQPDNSEGLKAAILHLIQDENRLSLMGRKSTQLINSVHTFENFVIQIEDFWKLVA